MKFNVLQRLSAGRILNRIALPASLLLFTLLIPGYAWPQKQAVVPEPSQFRIPTSNGLIVSVFDMSKNEVDYVYPHIFAAYDSGINVHPFISHIRPNTEEKPQSTYYVQNTHVIRTDYKNFSISYFASFTRHDKVFYMVARGKRDDIGKLDFTYETGEGKEVTGLTLLENPWEDLPIRMSGKLISGTFTKPYSGDIYERYFLFSLTDSLHTDPQIVSKAIGALEMQERSLEDLEVEYMRNVIFSCKIPSELKPAERETIEQSVTVLRMAQVSDYEVLPKSQGQVLASMRPGLWHVTWVRDGAFAIQAMTRLGMYEEARKALEFQLKADAGYYKHYIYKDGKDWGVGKDYQISLTRYFGNGREECDYNDYGPNIEYDDWGLFLIACCDYVKRSGDKDFFLKWNALLCDKVADATLHVIDSNGLIRPDSGPWEHHLQMPRQYAFTSGVCARGLELFAGLQKEYGLPFEKYAQGAATLKKSILDNMVVNGAYIKGNASSPTPDDHEYYDAGVYELFANGLISGKKLFHSHMKEYDKILRIQGERPGYIRLQGTDPYENQEWVFIDMRIASAHLLFGNKKEAASLIDYMTRQASANNHLLPEMISNKIQLDKAGPSHAPDNIWCNCIRDKDDQYIGMVPMVGYGAGAYVLAVMDYYGR